MGEQGFWLSLQNDFDLFYPITFLSFDLTPSYCEELF